MARVKVDLDHRELAALLKSTRVRGALRGPAERVLSEFKALAPVESGAYRDSAHLEQGTTDRAVVSVVVAVPYALALEAKNGTLNKAANAAKA